MAFLTKAQRLELLQRILNGVIELKNDGGLSWTATMAIGILQGWIEKERAKLQAETGVPPSQR